MAAARLGYLVGPSWLVAELEKVVLPYHLDAAKQAAGRLALRFTDEMEERVKAVVEERERVVAALAELPVARVAIGCELRAVPAARRRGGQAVWEGLLERSVLVRELLELAAAGGVPAGHGRHARRGRRIPRRPREVLA